LLLGRRSLLLEARVALAQESFSMPADVAEESDEVGARRPSRPGRARRAADRASVTALPDRGRPSDEGQLARMVRELHELEDAVVAKLTAAERLLAQLESRRIHEDVGKRDPTDARARQTKALTAIARALDRLRGLDGEIYQSAATARTTLSAIEGMRIFDECGYASFEEFLERALGPSPVLASVVALVASGPPAEQAGQPQAPAEISDEAHDPDDASETPFGESTTSLFDESPPPFAQSLDAGPAAGTSAAGAEGGSGQAAADAAEASASQAPRRRRLAGIVVSVVLCAAATVAGAAAGVWSGMAASGHGATEPKSDASVAPQLSNATTVAEPSAPARPTEGSHASPKHGSAER
jgi:hypothetical protein